MGVGGGRHAAVVHREPVQVVKGRAGSHGTEAGWGQAGGTV